MVVHRRKKKVRHRGYSRHGCGARKKHRGSGNRGGRGMAGTGKRADQKKPTILKLYGNTYFGKHGFHSVWKKDVPVCNLDDLERSALAKSNTLIKEKNGVFTADLKALGIGKLLGRGAVTRKWEVHGSVSKSAEEKIVKAGGRVVKEESHAVQGPAE